jgi:glycosyltransferase involved in cell wall biosynthesis
VPAITDLVTRLAGGFNITAYTLTRPGDSREDFICGGANVKVVPSREDGHIAASLCWLLQAFGRDHRRRPFHLAHGFWGLPGGLSAVLAGKMGSIPSVVSLLGGEAACLPEIGYGNMRKRWPRAATLWTCRSAAALTVLTRYQLELLERFGGARAAFVIPFGADPSLFAEAETRLPPPPFHFLHIGDLNRVKDQATLLKAFRLVTRKIDCRLRIIGRDHMSGGLQRLAGELGVAGQVDFAGYVPHAELGRHFAWAHLLVHSSLYEGQGVVFAEAASSGVPICGTRVGLLADRGESLGAAVQPGDPDALAASVLALATDDARMRELRVSARRWAEKHTAAWSADRFAAMYHALAPDHRPDASVEEKREPEAAAA